MVDVADLIVEKALIPHSKGPQILRTSVKVDWTAKSAHVLFRSVDVGNSHFNFGLKSNAKYLPGEWESDG
jgi:hypothetical protein